MYEHNNETIYFNDQAVFIPDCSENDTTICCWTIGSTRVELPWVSPTVADEVGVGSAAGTAASITITSTILITVSIEK